VSGEGERTHRSVSFVREPRKSGTEPVKLLRFRERDSMLVNVLKKEGRDSVTLFEVSVKWTRFVRELKVSGMGPVYLLPSRAKVDNEEREPKKEGMVLALVVVPPRLRYTRLAREVIPEGIVLSTFIKYANCRTLRPVRRLKASGMEPAKELEFRFTYLRDGSEKNSTGRLPLSSLPGMEIPVRAVK
jgi:hypothetical protein